MMICRTNRILIDADNIYIAKQLLGLKLWILQNLVIGLVFLIQKVANKGSLGSNTLLPHHCVLKISATARTSFGASLF